MFLAFFDLFSLKENWGFIQWIQAGLTFLLGLAACFLLSGILQRTNQLAQKIENETPEEVEYQRVAARNQRNRNSENTAMGQRNNENQNNSQERDIYDEEDESNKSEKSKSGYKNPIQQSN